MSPSPEYWPKLTSAIRDIGMVFLLRASGPTAPQEIDSASSSIHSRQNIRTNTGGIPIVTIQPKTERTVHNIGESEVNTHAVEIQVAGAHSNQIRSKTRNPASP